MDINSVNQYIKKSLIDYCSSCIADRTLEIGMQHMLYLSEDEFVELGKSKSIFSSTIASLKFGIISLASNFYLIVAGDKDFVCDNSDFLEVDISNSIFLSCVEYMGIKVPNYVNAYDILEGIYPPQEDEKQKGYSIELVSSFFEPLKVYIIPEEIALSNNSRMTAIGKLIVGNPHLKTLPFTEATTNSYSHFFDNGNFDFNIINSYMSYSWRYSFLDAYRCIEPIFRHIYLPKLKSDLGISLGIEDLGDLIERHCGWRPQETGSMEILFDEKNSYLSESLINTFKSIGLGSSTDEKIGKSIYRLRNKIVHHQDKYNQTESLLNGKH